MIVATGSAIGMPEGTNGRLAARSGMATKMRIGVGGGLIDSDYTREVKVIVEIMVRGELHIQRGRSDSSSQI